MIKTVIRLGKSTRNYGLNAILSLLGAMSVCLGLLKSLRFVLSFSYVVYASKEVDLHVVNGHFD